MRPGYLARIVECCKRTVALRTGNDESRQVIRSVALRSEFGRVRWRRKFAIGAVIASGRLGRERNPKSCGWTKCISNEGAFQDSVTVYSGGTHSLLRTITRRIKTPGALAFDSSGSLYVAKDRFNVQQTNNVTVYAPGEKTVLRQSRSAYPIHWRLMAREICILGVITASPVFAPGAVTCRRFARSLKACDTAGAGIRLGGQPVRVEPGQLLARRQQCNRVRTWQRGD